MFFVCFFFWGGAEDGCVRLVFHDRRIHHRCLYCAGDSCMNSENRPQKKSDDIISSLFDSLDDNDDMDMMGMSIPTA